MELFDLHTHSNVSDGTLSPVELVQKAKTCGLTAIALTDHDTINGCNEASSEAKRLGINFIPGVEISAMEYHQLHILGLGIDFNNKELKAEFEKCIEARRNQIYNICNLLEEKNIIIDADKILKSAGYSVGKAHIARVMTEKGYVKSISEAFDLYFETPEFKKVKKYKIGYKKAAELIHNAGGLVVLAHPHKIELTDMKLDEFVSNFTELDGIEAFYSEHTPRQAEYILELELAEKNNLLISCGSDFHGKNKPNIELGTGINKSLVKLRDMFPVIENRLIINKFL